MPARVASALGFPSREAFLTTYRERTTAVRAAYDRIFRQAMPDDPTPDDRAPDHPKPGHSMPGHSTPVERSRPPSETAHPRPYPSKRHPLQ
jgi:hypothetical protein